MIKSRSFHRHPSLLAILTLLMSCGTQAPITGPEPQPLPSFPFEIYQPSSTKKVYRIDLEHSRADILVRRGGKLARFGHDHLISAHSITGFVLFSEDDIKDSRVDLRIDLNSLIVDDPVIREKHVLDTQPSPQDIEKTAQNMQSKVLETHIWPQMHLNVAIIGRSLDVLEALVSIQLHGAIHTFPITINTVGLGEKRVEVNGQFKLHQSDFGIEPFSILGGGLRVLDQLNVSFQLEADQLD